MSAIEVSLAPGVRVTVAADGHVHLQHAEAPSTSLTLAAPSALVVALLNEGPVAAERLAGVASAVGGAAALAEWYVTLSALLSHEMIRVTVSDRTDVLATLTRLHDVAWLPFEAVDETHTWRLSRFALLHTEGETLVLTSAASMARVEIGKGVLAPVLQLMQLASGGVRAATARTELVRGCSEGACDALLSLLVQAGLLVPERDGVAGERAALEEWELADALLHNRSRLGRHRDPFGSTYPFAGTRASAPAVKPPMPGVAIPLRVPPPLDGDAPSPSFWSVLEARQSQRRHGTSPISRDQLGDFLHRTARVREVRDADATRPYAITSRPYPGGGAAYELEVYVVVEACAGLARGLYHYAPAAHALEPIPVAESERAAWLSETRMSASEWGERQLLILVAARFRRVTWKYRAIAYATVLKDVGVLLQTMSLVATAMGLAACPLGAGDGARLARALGTDYFEESSVGELTLGSAPDGA